MGRTAYLNGQWVPESELKISAWDLATMQGASCFEMLRSFNQDHFKLSEHLARLRHSCNLLSIPLPVDVDILESICEQVTVRNPLPSGEEHRLLIVVNAGAAPMYREIEGVIPYSYLYVATFPLRFTVAGFGKYFTEGVHCVTSKIQQVPDACIPSAAKHRSRLHFHLAQQQAPAGTWPLLRDDIGRYCEAPGANLAVVKDGEVFTYGVESRPALSGISLQTIRELTAAHETDLADWIADDYADELWLTCTPACMLPVVSLDGKPIGDGKIGPVFKETLGKWSELVGVDIQQQICDWDAQKIWTPDAQRLSTVKY